MGEVNLNREGEKQNIIKYLDSYLLGDKNKAMEGFFSDGEFNDQNIHESRTAGIVENWFGNNLLDKIKQLKEMEVDTEKKELLLGIEEKANKISSRLRQIDYGAGDVQAQIKRATEELKVDYEDIKDYYNQVSSGFVDSSAVEVSSNSREKTEFEDELETIESLGAEFMDGDSSVNLETKEGKGDKILFEAFRKKMQQGEIDISGVKDIFKRKLDSYTNINELFKKEGYSQDTIDKGQEHLKKISEILEKIKIIESKNK